MIRQPGFLQIPKLQHRSILFVTFADTLAILLNVRQNFTCIFGISIYALQVCQVSSGSVNI